MRTDPSGTADARAALQAVEDRVCARDEVEKIRSSFVLEQVRCKTALPLQRG